jgi:Flp pilus assembly protein TadD
MSPAKSLAEAVLLAEKACTLTSRKEPMFLGTLAQAYARSGRKTDAITTLDQALKLAQESKQEGLIGQIEKMKGRLMR